MVLPRLPGDEELAVNAVEIFGSGEVASCLARLAATTSVYLSVTVRARSAAIPAIRIPANALAKKFEPEDAQKPIFTECPALKVSASGREPDQ